MSFSCQLRDISRMLAGRAGDRPAGTGTRAVNEANHRNPGATSHIKDRKPGSVTIDIGSLDMTKRDRDLAKRETGAVTARAARPAGRRARGAPPPPPHRLPPGGRGGGAGAPRAA